MNEENDWQSTFWCRTCVCDSGFRDCRNLCLKVSYSDESSVSQYAKDGPDGVITFEDTRPVEKEEYREKVSNAAPEEENGSEENLLKLFESYLGKLDIKVCF